MSLGLSPRVLVSLMMMKSLSWACLGREGTCYASFQHCVFHREIRGAWGLWLNLHLPLPLAPPSLSSSSACLSHTDYSVCSDLLWSFFILLLIIMCSSIYMFHVHVCKDRSERWIGVISDQWEVIRDTDMQGKKQLGFLTCHKNVCSNI